MRVPEAPVRAARVSALWLRSLSPSLVWEIWHRDRRTRSARFLVLRRVASEGRQCRSLRESTFVRVDAVRGVGANLA